MKRNRICYLLVIIAICITANVYALAPDEFLGYSFCSLGSTGTTYHNYPGNSEKYSYHEQTFTPAAGGDKMTMYCTFPQEYSTTVSPTTGHPNMICSMATTGDFPESYKLLKLVQTKNITDAKVLDLAFRMVGMYDRVNNLTLVVTQSSKKQVKTLYNTYLTRVLDQTNTGFDGYYLSGPDVDTAVSLLKEARTQDISDMNPSATPSGESQKGIFSLELVGSDEHSKTYIIKANRNVPNPSFSVNNIHIDWVEAWNGTQGKIKITTLSERNCNGSVTISADVAVGNSSALYTCKLTVSGAQHFIAIGPSKAGDTFDVSTCPEPECIKSGCGVVDVNTEVKVIDIFNCCEEGAVTKVRQAALDELFCKDGTLNIEYYKPKCNAETYKVDESAFCEMYCGSTAMYELPGPTHAKADAYFYFSKKRTGVTGPVLDQYKRCRNIIHFDKWIDNYKAITEQTVQALNDYNYYIVKYNNMKNAQGTSHTETYTVTCPNPSGSRTPVVSTVDVPMTKYVVSSGSYNRYKSTLNGSYTSYTITDDTSGTVDGATYYSKASIETAVNKYNELVNNNSNCTVSGNSSFPEYEQNKADAESAANGALSNYNALVGSSNELRNKLAACSGKTDASGKTDTSEIKNKVKYTSEPKMDFSYNQVFLNDKGKLTSQELAVNFEKVNGKCAYEVYDSLDQPDKNSPNWNKNWDIIGIYGVKYSTTKYGTGALSIDTLKTGITFGNQAGSVNTLKDAQFYASKKFTIDAVGHMTCKWQDSPYNKTYTLIPGGIISTTTITGNIKDLGGVYTEHTGTYQIVKTHAKGKFETYFTLKNLADGIFDDIIHNGGQTCAEKYADIKQTYKEKADGVNATCYIDIENNGLTLYDCTQTEVISKNDSDEYYNKTCCDKDSCYGGNVIDYKEVDPAELFPNTYSDNYAVNWLRADDPDAQEALKHIQDAAKNENTYSPRELTYSFTLKPSDLKAIRAYNKAQTDKGGYTDFNMNCLHVETSDGRTTAVKCESKFLNAISGGDPLEYGNGGKLELKTNNIDLIQSRSNWK